MPLGLSRVVLHEAFAVSHHAFAHPCRVGVGDAAADY